MKPAIQYAIIAAAGMGTRLHRNMPKALAEISGRKIVSYQMELLKEIPHVRIVVGYQADEVIQTVKEIRPDVEFILNENYASTNTLQSYYLGCKDLQEPFLLMDGDIIPQKASLDAFLQAADGGNLIGISGVNTEDAVFVHLDQNHCIKYFSRAQKSPYEWSNIAVVHPKLLAYENTYVFEQYEKLLPLPARRIVRLEVDTPSDIQYAESILSSTPVFYLEGGL